MRAKSSKQRCPALCTHNYHMWAVPRYFFGTGTVGPFVVPVPPKNSKVPRYRSGTLVFLFFSTDFKNVPLKT